MAFSGTDGAYKVFLGAGVYALGVQPAWSSAPALWWDGKAIQSECDLVGVDDGSVTEGVDFALP